MNGIQIRNALDIIPETYGKFKGLFLCTNVPFELFHQRECFFIVNTLTRPSGKMGHWLLFFIKNYKLYFFDSFGLTPETYNWDINDFYHNYPYEKLTVFDKAIQNDSSYVGGSYVIFFAYSMCKEYSLCRIISTFTDKKKKK